jgi:hypothetical protein
MSEKSADQSGLPLLEIRNLKMYFPVKGGVFMTAKAQCKIGRASCRERVLHTV